VLARQSASARRRENGNPEAVPAEAGNIKIETWILPASSAGQALLPPAYRRQAGTTNSKNNNLTCRNQAGLKGHYLQVRKKELKQKG